MGCNHEDHLVFVTFGIFVIFVLFGVHV